MTAENGAESYNARVLRKLKRSLEKDPCSDLSLVLPESYSKRLKLKKEQVPCQEKVKPAEETAINEEAAIECDTVGLAASVQDVTVIRPLSSEVEILFDAVLGTDLSTQLRHIITNGEILWSSLACTGNAVVKCGSAVVVKIVPRLEDYIEYDTLGYLNECAPTVPVPKPMGLLISNHTRYIFMSLIPGPTLGAIWATLAIDQKKSIQDQLEKMLATLRAIERPVGGLLGAIGGGKCKDTRRHVRVNEQPIHSAAEFRDFLFSKPHYGTLAYNSLLQNLLGDGSEAVVFTHGDLRPDNIVVQPDERGCYVINGILDWEKSGFYPEYFESFKATNNLSPIDADDWYLYLPSSAASKNFALPWLVDRLWDKQVA